MVAMLSRMCSMMRQDGSQQWGFWLQGGRDQGRPVTICKVGDNSIADLRGLRLGDTILQIGRERTVDMTYVDAQNAVLRAGNRLDILVLRPANQEEKVVLVPTKDERVPIRAIVHKQSNSPIGLYSAENVADTFIEQTKVLTKGAIRLQRNPQSVDQRNMANVQRSDVYRMVHEEDSTDEYTSSSSNSPTPYSKPQQTPVPPPKPVAARPDAQQQRQQQPSPQQQPQRQQQPSPQQQQQQQRQQQPSPQQLQQQRQQQPSPQQQQPQRQQQPPQQQPQRQQQPPPPQQQQPQRQQQPPPPQPKPQQPPQQRPQQAPQQQNNYQPQHQQPQPRPQQQQQQYQQQQQFYQQQLYRREEEEDYSDRPKYQPYPQAVSQPKPAQTGRPGSTFQSNIPFAQNSTQSPQQPHDGPGVEQIQWSPTTGRRRPVWPPPKQDEVLSTSSQSMKFAGGRPSKQFIWPPPKDFIEVTEEVQGNQRSVIYRHVPEHEANKSRVYVSPRAPARLAAQSWEPYTQSGELPHWMKGSCPSKRLRRFDDIFSSNSTRLPPTYRAPPGTAHVST